MLVRFAPILNSITSISTIYKHIKFSRKARSTFQVAIGLSTYPFLVVRLGVPSTCQCTFFSQWSHYNYQNVIYGMPNVSKQKINFLGGAMQKNGALHKKSRTLKNNWGLQKWYGATKIKLGGLPKNGTLWLQKRGCCASGGTYLALP